MDQATQGTPTLTSEYTYTRSSPRAFVILPVTVSFGDETQHYPGIIRDISQDGIFFYCDVKPELQSQVNLIVRVGSAAAIAYKGKVVRIEEPLRGAAVGIAIQIQRSGSASSTSH